MVAHIEGERGQADLTEFNMIGAKLSERLGGLLFRGVEPGK